MKNIRFSMKMKWTITALLGAFFLLPLMANGAAFGGFGLVVAQ